MGDFMRRSHGVRRRYPASPTHSLEPPQGTPCGVGVEASLVPLESEPELAADTKTKGTKVPSLGP